MPLCSMTGFGRSEGAHGDARWIWEVKSVNGRGLEPRFRLPPGLDFLESDLRKALSEQVARGSVSAFLNLKSDAGARGLSINRAALASALDLVAELRTRVECDKPRPEGLLAIPGVLETENVLDDEDERRALSAAILDSFRGAVGMLVDARRKEGASLAALIGAHLDTIEKLSRAARASEAASPAAIRDRLAQQLGDLLAGAIPEERIAQEAALLAVKVDIREELDRLDAHVGAARALLGEESAAGRKLDFLTQEFNREANTLCSKTPDLALKRIGLDLKASVDQMREQVQNVE
jgi:uncharacterized protein (TIGR00255 family)